MTTHRKSLIGLALVAALPVAAYAEPTTLLNVSYDVSRELYKEINPAFSAYWKAKEGTDVTVNQSHGPSTKQALSVAAGLEADVVTLNQPTDLAHLAKTGVVSADWKKKFPSDAAPYTTTSIFLVRKGNPKGIKDWNDLTKPGVSVVIPNPKTSGNGRYTYLAAWGYALENLKTEDKAREFVSNLIANVPILDGGGRGATTSFTQRDVGDVLVTFENEAALVTAEFGDKFDAVYPSVSIEAAPPVAVVETVAAARGTAALAKAYLAYLFTDDAQRIIAKHDFRPRSEKVLAENVAKFPPIKTFKLEDHFESWETAQDDHFKDGGVYDQIVEAQAKAKSN